MISSSIRQQVILAAFGWLALAGAAAAQQVGNVATMEGTVEVGRGGQWAAAQPGTAVNSGDVVRTGRPGRARIVFQDNSVLKVTDGSEVKITAQIYDPGSAQNHSVLDVVRGKVRSIVSDYYKDPSARFEVRTATAVAGVRGTDFIVAYDEATARTEVVGVTGTVAVGGAAQPNRKPTILSARQVVTVNRDGFVSSTQRIGDAVFRQYLDGVDFIGGGAAESVTSQLTDGSNVAPPERIGAIGGAVPIGGTSIVRTFAEDGTFPPDGAGLIDQPPGALGVGEVGPF